MAVSKTKKIKLTKGERVIVEALTNAPAYCGGWSGSKIYLKSGDKFVPIPASGENIRKLLKKEIIGLAIDGILDSDPVRFIPFKLNPTVL